MVKKTNKPLEGQLVLDYSDNFYGCPLWGFVLPQDKFVKRFETAKGEKWPAVLKITNDNYNTFTKKWGYNMPMDKWIGKIPFPKGVTYTVLQSNKLASAEHSLGVLYLPMSLIRSARITLSRIIFSVLVSPL